MNDPINEIDIWQITLDGPEAQWRDCLGVLSVEELAQGERFLQEKHRRRYRASHVALHHILSGYLDVAPEKIMFKVGEHGKPFLSGELAASGLQFNLSGSAERALLAVSPTQPVGVDIEWVKPIADMQGIMRRFFTESECQQWLALSAAERLHGFYRCWTRNEAFVKALGVGLSFSLDRFEVDINSTDMDCLRQIDGDLEASRQWALGSLPIESKDYIAALAVAGECPSTHLRKYCFSS